MDIAINENNGLDQAASKIDTDQILDEIINNDSSSLSLNDQLCNPEMMLTVSDETVVLEKQNGNNDQQKHQQNGLDIKHEVSAGQESINDDRPSTPDINDMIEKIIKYKCKLCRCRIFDRLDQINEHCYKTHIQKKMPIVKKPMKRKCAEPSKTTETKAKPVKESVPIKPNSESLNAKRSKRSKPEPVEYLPQESEDETESEKNQDEDPDFEIEVPYKKKSKKIKQKPKPIQTNSDDATIDPTSEKSEKPEKISQNNKKNNSLSSEHETRKSRRKNTLQSVIENENDDVVADNIDTKETTKEKLPPNFHNLTKKQQKEWRMKVKKEIEKMNKYIADMIDHIIKEPYSHLPRRKKGEERREFYTCDWPGCSYQSKKMSAVRMHKFIHSGERRFKCTWENCTKTFVQPACLRAHVRKHIGARPYKCKWPNCGRAFGQLSTLEVHTRFHTGEKPFHCEWPGCDAKFPTKGNLDQHRLVHSGEKKFACDFPGCKIRCVTNFHLKKHKLTHSEEKPYKCDWEGCIFRSNRKDHVEKHRECHTGWKSPCPFCDKRYLRISHVQRHIRQRHPEITIKKSEELKKLIDEKLKVNPMSGFDEKPRIRTMWRRPKPKPEENATTNTTTTTITTATTTEQPESSFTEACTSTIDSVPSSSSTSTSSNVPTASTAVSLSEVFLSAQPQANESQQHQQHRYRHHNRYNYDQSTPSTIQSTSFAQLFSNFASQNVVARQQTSQGQQTTHQQSQNNNNNNLHNQQTFLQFLQ